MALNSLSIQQLWPMKMEERLDHYAKEILLKGFGRPWKVYAAHAAVFASNYGGFLAVFHRDFLRLLRYHRGQKVDSHGPGGESPQGKEEAEKEKRSLALLLFVKFLVWQHLAEAIGCRQGPLGMHFGLPNNWKYRFSLGTLKYPLLSVLGKKRNIFDLLAHVLFFASGAAFLTAKEYKLKYIRALCACDVWICLSDLSQFFCSTGHAYFSMLLSACFPQNGGRLAGIQMGLLMQWFFSGIGKIGPWFGYVNAPFMLQSKFFAGQRWLFDLLIKSPTDLSPTKFGAILGHTFAAVEYLAPIALMIPKKVMLWKNRGASSAVEHSTLAKSSAPHPEKAEVPTHAKEDFSVSPFIWFGLTGIVGMHFYILSMPAPFDVYSWNACFGLSAIYLFFYGSFGFDHEGAKTMSPALAAYLIGEFALCWYGQFYPDQVGYYLSHRYWAGNWVQTFFYAKNTDAVRRKLGLVKSFSSPQVWQSLQKYGMQLGTSNFAYLWLANLNMKAFVGLIQEALRLVGGPGANMNDYFGIGLPQFCCGEFRDNLYSVPLLPAMQEQIGFDSGECFMVRLGAFGMFRNTATWGIYDLKDGLLKSGLLSLSALSQMDAFPSQSGAHVAALMNNQ